MSLIPMIRANQMVRVLLKAGFKAARQAGSHRRFIHPITRRATTVPIHASDLSRKIMSKIIKQSGLTVEEILRLLR